MVNKTCSLQPCFITFKLLTSLVPCCRCQHCQGIARVPKPLVFDLCPTMLPNVGKDVIVSGHRQKTSSIPPSSSLDGKRRGTELARNGGVRRAGYVKSPHRMTNITCKSLSYVWLTCMPFKGYCLL